MGSVVAASCVAWPCSCLLRLHVEASDSAEGVGEVQVELSADDL